MNRDDFKVVIINIKENSDNGLICKTFKDEHFDAIEMKNEDKTYEYINENHIDLVIINSNTSDDSIKEILATLNKTNTILLTNDLSKDLKQDFLSLGLIDYKIKLNNLMLIIDELIVFSNKIIRNNEQKILLIKKKSTDITQIESLLSKYGYKVEVAFSGTAGWKAMNNDIAMIILDITVDDINIIDLIQKAKKKYTHNIPILAITEIFDSNLIQDSIHNGLSDFIKLPVMPEIFNLKIDLWINNVIQSKQLQEQKNSIDALANATIEALIMFDDNICIDMNDEALNMFDYKSKDELIGKNLLDIVSKNITKYDKEELLKNNVDHEFELLMSKKNEIDFPAQIKERNINLDSKQIKIIAVLDLSEIKKKEKMLTQQSKLASMGEMIGNIAHQWRQPLSSISVAASGIKINYELDMVDEKELFRELDSIVESTIFLSDTIDDFQSFIKGDAIRSKFIVEDAIKKVLKLVEGNIKSANIDVIQNYDNNIEMFGFANEFIQAMLNIINNARDALKDKDLKPKLIIINTTFNNRKEDIVVSVQDNAGGIPSTIINKIFEPYFTTKHQSQGTGLGLYMTHQMIVDHMNGKIEVSNEEFEYDNKENFGAKFVITLPVKRK